MSALRRVFGFPMMAVQEVDLPFRLFETSRRCCAVAQRSTSTLIALLLFYIVELVFWVPLRIAHAIRPRKAVNLPKFRLNLG